MHKGWRACRRMVDSYSISSADPSVPILISLSPLAPEMTEARLPPATLPMVALIMGVRGLIEDDHGVASKMVPVSLMVASRFERPRDEPSQASCEE